MKERILLFDIETAPLVSEAWGFYEQTALRVVRASYLICFAYKWLGDKTIRAVSPLTHHGRTMANDKKRVKALWDLFNKADIVVAHNGDAFDVRLAMAYFVHNGLPPPRPFKSVDTKKVAKRHFRFYANKLDELGAYLGFGRKLFHPGYTLWVDCMDGKRKALQKMVEYNKRDVELLENIYLRLRPYMDNHPNYNVILDRVTACPNCGGHTLQARGWYITRVSKAQRYHCQDCGAWSHGKLQRHDVELR